MARAVEPRPGRLAAGFAVYAALVTAAAYWYSPQIAPYVDPGATFWISTAYVVLGAAALAALCVGALVRAHKLEDRLEDLEALQHRVQELENPMSPPIPDRVREAARVSDSGSAETEVEALLDGLAEITDRVHRAPTPRPSGDPRTSAVALLLQRDTWEMTRLRRARDAVGAAVAGPAVAAILLLGIFAPLLPASDGMLLSSLSLSAFFGVAGLGCLVGLPVYAALAFRQIRVHAP